MLRLSYGTDNTAAGELYASLGFRPTGEEEDGEVVVELAASAVR